jgi:hypothetical protein
MATLAKRFAVAKRKVRNALLDVRYGGILRGTIETSYADQGATSAENTPCDVLTEIFTPDTIRSSDVLVDVGCGKGRVINWWLNQGYQNRIIGIELDPEIAAGTRQRLRRYSNVSIVCGDAVDNLPANGTVYYLYNPFGAPIMEAFRDRLCDFLDDSGDTRIYYYHPLHLGVFENDSRWEVVDRRPVNPLWPEMEVAVIRSSRSAPEPGSTGQAGHV